MFSTLLLNFPEKTFLELSKSSFEEITIGRYGAILKNKDNTVVRTTTKYNTKPQPFQDIHYDIINAIQTKFTEKMCFNNAMIEMYTDDYRSMGFHSDQALDLDPDSFIAIYSCYSNPEKGGFRTLIIKEKGGSDNFEIPMLHNSVIIFSVQNNSKYLHKIILKQCRKNTWLGITFRLSRTIDKKLRLANQEEKREFFRLRKLENTSIDFSWSDIDYTISPSDLL